MLAPHIEVRGKLVCCRLSSAEYSALVSDCDARAFESITAYMRAALEAFRVQGRALHQCKGGNSLVNLSNELSRLIAGLLTINKALAVLHGAKKQ